MSAGVSLQAACLRLVSCLPFALDGNWLSVPFAAGRTGSLGQNFRQGRRRVDKRPRKVHCRS